jgi:hypothetical protein
MKIEAVISSETSANYRITRRHIPDDGNLHRHSCEDLKLKLKTFLYHLGFEVLTAVVMKSFMGYNALSVDC